MVQTTEQKCCKNQSPSSLPTFSLRTARTTCRDRSRCWPIRLIASVDRSNSEGRGAMRGKSCKRKVVQTTEQKCCENQSPSSLLAFSLRTARTTCRDRSLCRPIRLIATTECSSQPCTTHHSASEPPAWCALPSLLSLSLSLPPSSLALLTGRL